MNIWAPFAYHSRFVWHATCFFETLRGQHVKGIWSLHCDSIVSSEWPSKCRLTYFVFLYVEVCLPSEDHVPWLAQHTGHGRRGAVRGPRGMRSKSFGTAQGHHKWFLQDTSSILSHIEPLSTPGPSDALSGSLFAKTLFSNSSLDRHGQSRIMQVKGELWMLTIFSSMPLLTTGICEVWWLGAVQVWDQDSIWHAEK